MGDEIGNAREPSRRTLLSLIGAATASATIPAGSASQAQTPVSGPASRLSGPLRSAGTLAFGPKDVLFVGDTGDGAVHAFAFQPTDFTSQGDVELGNWHNFEGRDLIQGVNEKLAALLGTTPDQIVINDMVVHQPTQQIILSVERGRSTDAIPVIAKVDHGKLVLVDLSRTAHTRISLPNLPNPQAMMEFYTQRSFAITDICPYKDEILVSGVSNQRFASTLYRIPYPFGDQMATSTVEIWHPVHGEWETRAPIIKKLVRDVGGEPHLYAVYGCTPLVRLPLAALKDGAHVRGDVIGELGYGANPIDMLIFNSVADKKDYLVVTIDTRSASRIAAVDLDTAAPEPTGGAIDFGPGGLGRTQGLLPINAEHFAMLDPYWAVQLQRHPKTGYRLDISTVAAPYFFERRDGMSEMNWPDGPDPFEYRTHRNEISTGASQKAT